MSTDGYTMSLQYICFLPLLTGPHTYLLLLGSFFYDYFLISRVIKLKMSTVCIVLIYSDIWSNGHYLWFSVLSVRQFSCKWLFSKMFLGFYLKAYAILFIPSSQRDNVY